MEFKKYNEKIMQNIATIYRFKTPFLNLNKEVEKIKKIVDCMINYLEYEWFKYSLKKQEVNNYLNFLIDVEEFVVLDFKVITNSFNDDFYLPIFQLDISWKIQNKRDLVIFLTNIFECFDGVNEEEYLVDISDDIYYKNWFFSKKVYPHYDFQNINKVYKQFKKDDGVKVLEEFLKKYYDGFVLNMDTKKEYHKVNSYLIFFMYLLSTMQKVLFKLDENRRLLENTEWNMYVGHLELQKKRLEMLWENTKQAYDKHYQFLRNFLELFER